MSILGQVNHLADSRKFNLGYIYISEKLHDWFHYKSVFFQLVHFAHKLMLKSPLYNIYW